MGLRSWKKEFYPIPLNKTTKANAVEHSLKKWEGLTEENLAKHGLTAEKLEPTFSVSDATCALCYHHLDIDGCGECPLYLVRDGVQCDDVLWPEENFSPYWAWCIKHDPHLMIKWLKKALKWQQKRSAKNAKK